MTCVLAVSAAPAVAERVAAIAPAAAEPPASTAVASAWVQEDGVLPAARGEGGTGGLRGVLTADRARILLRSLTVPGWGQASLGRNRSAVVFALVEAGVWGSYASFRIQDKLRTDAYENTARIFAGIDLEDRDEEFRRIVGAFPSSEVYNILVVRREAANIYYPRGDLAGYNAYIAQHELKGPNAWSWVSPESFERYRDQRARAQRAARRANTALAAAVANRLLSAIHAARAVHRGAAPPASSGVGVFCLPSPEDPTGVRMGLAARF